MTTSINSVVAYHELEDLLERQAVVYRIVAENPGISYPEIYRILRRRGIMVKENSVTPRLTELVDLGRIKIVGTKINRLEKTRYTKSGKPRAKRKVNMYAARETLDSFGKTNEKDLMEDEWN